MRRWKFFRYYWPWFSRGQNWCFFSTHFNIGYWSLHFGALIHGRGFDIGIGWKEDITRHDDLTNAGADT